MNTNENKQKIIMLFIVLGIFITIITGVTFSYLAPTINNLENESTVAFNAGVIAIDFKNGINQIEASDILPGWSKTKTFSLIATNTTSIRKADAMNYSLKLIVESNTFSDNAIAVSLKSTNTSNNGTIAKIIPGTLLSGASEVSLGFGSFDATKEIGEAGAKHDFELTVSFPEQYRSQSSDMGKHLSAHVSIGKANELGTLTIADNYEKTNITTSVEKNKEVTLLSLYKYPVNRYLSIVSGEGTINANKLTLKSDEMKVAINYPSITNTISSLDKDENGLEVDDTPDKNLRYVGASPKNYINFNNETWRIVGVFNNITSIDEQGNTKKESLVKIVRNESLGSYSWDATGNINYGFNNWTEADLKNELNGDYLNTALTSNKTNWYNSYWESGKPVLRQTGVFDYTKVIKSNYQNMISESVWNIGGNTFNNPNTPPYGLPLLDQYNKERGTITYQNSRPTTWTGKVGLIYASDYGYASTNSECRENLRAGVKYDTSNNSWDYLNGKCKTDNWLAKSSWYWTVSPYSGYSDLVFGVYGDGTVNDFSAYDSGDVFPAVFLKSDVVIAGGTGNEKDPYKILKSS